MTTRTVRIPGETYERLRTLAAVTDRTPGDVLEAAFSEYLVKHRADVRDSFRQAQKLIAGGDTEGLMDMTSDARKTQARRAAMIARQGRPAPEGEARSGASRSK